MCGRACTPRTRAAARALTGAVREVGWLPGQRGRLNSSRTRRLPSELKVQIDTWLVAGARRHGGAVGHRRELSDPGIRARLAGAALRASALTPIGRGDTPENRIAPRNDARPRTADYENVPGHQHYIPPPRRRARALSARYNSRAKLVWSFGGRTYTELFSAMRPRPWLLLCVSLHGVAASVHGFPSGKHGLDYCIAEADTHHRHDSVDHHGSSNVYATMDKPCTLYASHHLGAWHVRAQPQPSRKI